MRELPWVRFSPEPKNWQTMGRDRKYVVIVGADDLESCCGRLRPVVDFSKHMLIMAYRGECPTGGYWIRITDVIYDREEGRVQIEVAEGSPGPEDMVTMAFTYPVDMVLVERRMISPGTINVEFRARQRLLAELSVTV